MLRNGLYNFIGSGVRIGLGIVTVPILINLLGTDGYGIYSIIMSVIAFAILSEWSISLTLNVFLSQDIGQGGDKEALLIGTTLISSLIVIVGLAVLITIILWFTAPILPALLKELSTTEVYTVVIGCRLLIFIVWSRLLHQYFIGIEQAYNKYALLNVITTTFNVTQAICILITAYLYKDILIILWIQSAISSVFVLVHALVCYKMGFLKYFSLKMPVKLRSVQAVLGYSSRVWLGTIGSVIFNQGDRLVIGSVMTPSAVGIYSALTSLAYQINSFSAAPVQPLMSIINRILLTEEAQLADRLKLLTGVKKALLLNTSIAIGMGSLIMLFAHEVVTIFFHKQPNLTDQTVLHLKLITLIYTLYSFNAVGFFILYAIKREIINTVVVLFCGLLSLSLITLLTVKYGLTGAVIGNSAYVLTLFLLYKGLREVRVSLHDIISTIQVPLILFLGVSVLTFTTQNFLVRCSAAFILISCLSLFGLLKIRALLKTIN